MERVSSDVSIDMDKCIEMLPCIHKVEVNNERKEMSAVNIIKEYKKRNIPVPAHFQQYLNKEYAHFFNED